MTFKFFESTLVSAPTMPETASSAGRALNISHETTGHTAYAGYRNICYLAVRNLGVPVDTAGKCTRGEIGRIVFVQGEQTLKIEVKIYLSECQQFQRLQAEDPKVHPLPK